MRQEGSRFLEDGRPVRLVATQGRGRFLRRFELSIEADPDGPVLRGQVTSPEDWPAHERKGLVRLGVGLAMILVGILATGVGVAAHVDDLPLIACITLFAAGAPVAIAGNALYRNAKLLAKGEQVPFWLGSTKP
jgi:hypothetical protein